MRSRKRKIPSLSGNFARRPLTYRIFCPKCPPFFRLKTVHLVVHLNSKKCTFEIVHVHFWGTEIVHVQKIMENNSKNVQKMYMYNVFV